MFNYVTPTLQKCHGNHVQSSKYALIDFKGSKKHPSNIFEEHNQHIAAVLLLIIKYKTTLSS